VVLVLWLRLGWVEQDRVGCMALLLALAGGLVVQQVP
jgi:hypothetical protein